MTFTGVATMILIMFSKLFLENPITIKPFVVMLFSKASLLFFVSLLTGKVGKCTSTSHPSCKGVKERPRSLKISMYDLYTYVAKCIIEI